MGKVFHENDENVRSQDGLFKLLYHVSDIDPSDICLFRWHGLHFDRTKPQWLEKVQVGARLEETLDE